MPAGINPGWIWMRRNCSRQGTAALSISEYRMFLSIHLQPDFRQAHLTEDRWIHKLKKKSYDCLKSNPDESNQKNRHDLGGYLSDTGTILFGL